MPYAFARLYHLEVLDVKDFEQLSFASSEDMSNLINLRHIKIYWFKARYFPYIGRLESLRVLDHFTIRKEKGYELSQLKLLNKIRGILSIYHLENVSSREDALQAQLHEKKYLTKVTLNWGWNRETNDQERELHSEVLEALRPPMMLQTLSIDGYRGTRYPSWMMDGGSEVPVCLQDLELENCSELGSIPKHSKLFRSLLKLSITNCYWDYFPDNMEHLESLMELYFNEFRYLKSLPTVLPQSLQKLWVMAGCHKIHSLPVMPQSLVYFELESFSYKFIESCKTPGDQNYENILHIPSKKIRHLWSDNPQ